MGSLLDTARVLDLTDEKGLIDYPRSIQKIAVLLVPEVAMKLPTEVGNKLKTFSCEEADQVVK